MKPMIFSLCLALSATAFAADVRPNVILIIADDQGFGDYGFMGSKVAQTPHLDRIAAQSQLYTRGYTSPLCSPSLASLLTGKLPHQHGIIGNDLAPSNAKGKDQRHPLVERLLGNSLLLPKTLSDAGYLTFQTGKLWNTTFKEVGFTHGMTTAGSRHGDAGLDIGRKGLDPIFNFIQDAGKQEKPFFVWYAPMMPHTPHDPPQTLLRKYQGQGLTPDAEKYYAMVEWFDQTCGELDEYLTENGLEKNTVVLFLSDNGWDAATGLAAKRAKLSPYELGIRTPMFVRWPDKVAAVRNEETLASIIDVVPTILNVAGVKVPAELPGLDLSDGKAMAARKSIFVEVYTHDIADLAVPSTSLVTQVVIHEWMKLLIPGPARLNRNKATSPTSVELYDLKADPLEKTSLAAQRPDEVTRLRAIQDVQWNVR